MAREPDRNERENPSHANRYAVAILRKLDERIDRIENRVAREGTPNVIRAADEVLSVTETVATSTSVSDPALTWDDQSAAASTWDDTTESWA